MSCIIFLSGSPLGTNTSLPEKTTPKMTTPKMTDRSRCQGPFCRVCHRLLGADLQSCQVWVQEIHPKEAHRTTWWHQHPEPSILQVPIQVGRPIIFFYNKLNLSNLLEYDWWSQIIIYILYKYSNNFFCKDLIHNGDEDWWFESRFDQRFLTTVFSPPKQ